MLGKRRISDMDKSLLEFSSYFEEKEEEEEFEEPTTPFEWYLSYDQPQKKKKKKILSHAVPEVPDIPLPLIQADDRSLPSAGTPALSQRKREEHSHSRALLATAALAGVRSSPVSGPCTRSTPSVLNSRSTSSSQNGRKPPAKKVPPLLAKTIRDYKKVLSRR